MKPAHWIGIVLCAASVMQAPNVYAAELTEPRPMVKVEPEGRYKVVYDINKGDLAAGISKGLYYARGLIEAFGKQGVKPSQLDVHRCCTAKPRNFC